MNAPATKVPPGTLPPRPRHTAIAVNRTKARAAAVQLFDPYKRWKIICDMVKVGITEFRQEDAAIHCAHPEAGRIRLTFRAEEIVGCLYCGSLNPEPDDLEVARVKQLTPEQRVKDLVELSAGFRPD